MNNTHPIHPIKPKDSIFANYLREQKLLHERYLDGIKKGLSPQEAHICARLGLKLDNNGSK